MDSALIITSIFTQGRGLAVTDNPEYAEKMRLIRNHGEAVVEDKGQEDITNCLGFNFRLGEIEAAIGEAVGKITEHSQAKISSGQEPCKDAHLPGIDL